MRVEKSNLEVSREIRLDAVTIVTGEDPQDSSIFAKLELKGDSPILNRVRRLLDHSHQSVTPHAVDATVAGEFLIERLLTQLTDAREVKFPEDWKLDVEVREEWPRVDGVLKLKLNGGQDVDAVAILLEKVGISHEYGK